jgi:hypothetical protein
MLYLTRHACTLYSKRGNRVYRFQELAEQVRAEVPRRELILDGEIVAIDDEGRINFWELMRGGGRWPMPLSMCSGSTDGICGACHSPNGNNVSSECSRWCWCVESGPLLRG